MVAPVLNRVITTEIATTISGIPTTIPTVLTIAPPPTMPPSGDGNSGVTRQRVLLGFSRTQYFAFTHLPTLIAACLAIPFGVIGANARLMQPFHALATREGGGPGPDTFTLSFGGYHAVTAPFGLSLLTR